jgi:DNA-directed RNA polymerase specialized sigma24 family protein
MMQEECQRLLGRLKKRDVQLVALLKVDGYTNEEVANRLGCTRRSVQRRLELIRHIWGEDVA